MIPDWISNQIATDAERGLSRSIEHAKVLGDPLGEVPKMETELARLRAIRVGSEPSDAGGA